MKKITSLIMAVLMLCTMLSVFAVPAFAEEEPKVIEPNGIINFITAGNYVIKDGEYTIGSFNSGNFQNRGVVLTIPKGVTVTVTGNFRNFGTLYVHGTLIVTASTASNDGTIHVGCGGKLKGAISGSTGTFTYEEHTFADGKCTKCDTPESEVGKDDPTEIAPAKGADLTIYNKDDLIICKNCEIDTLKIGNSSNKGMSLTIPKDVTVTVNRKFDNYGTLHVYGTLNITAGSANNNGTIHMGCSGKIEGTIDDILGGKTVKDEHELTNGFCACGYFDSEQHEHELTNGFCACGYFDLDQHEHIFEEGKCACGEPEPVVGSILSDGNLWIIIAVAVVALGGIVALIIVKKKKKPALASGESKDKQ